MDDKISIINYCIQQRRRRIHTNARNDLLLLQLAQRSTLNAALYCNIQCHSRDLYKILNGDTVCTKKHLRVSFETLMKLSSLIPIKRHGWSTEYELIVFLFWLACGTSYRVVGMAMNLARTTVFRVVKRILKHVVNLRHSVIKLPTPDKLSEIGYAFSRLGHSEIFEKVAGAVDGCHVRITCPKSLHEEYTNRKCFLSLQLQAVCDHTAKFINVFSGWPGSVHDQRIFRNSTLYQHGSYPPAGHFLIGDSGYACRLKPVPIITPFKGNTSTEQHNFNFHLSQARIVIERSFGMMKVRWRSIFTKALELKLAKATEVIIACCVMHNVCVSMGDVLNESCDDIRRPQTVVQPDTNEGVAFRQTLCDRLNGNRI